MPSQRSTSVRSTIPSPFGHLRPRTGTLGPKFGQKGGRFLRAALPGAVHTLASARRGKMLQVVPAGTVAASRSHSSWTSAVALRSCAGLPSTHGRLKRLPGSKAVQNPLSTALVHCWAIVWSSPAWLRLSRPLVGSLETMISAVGTRGRNTASHVARRFGQNRTTARPPPGIHRRDPVRGDQVLSPAAAPAHPAGRSSAAAFTSRARSAVFED